MDELELAVLEELEARPQPPPLTLTLFQTPTPTLDPALRWQWRLLPAGGLTLSPYACAESIWTALGGEQQVYQADLQPIVQAAIDTLLYHGLCPAHSPVVVAAAALNVAVCDQATCGISSSDIDALIETVGGEGGDCATCYRRATTALCDSNPSLREVIERARPGVVMSHVRAFAAVATPLLYAGRRAARAALAATAACRAPLRHPSLQRLAAASGFEPQGPPGRAVATLMARGPGAGGKSVDTLVPPDVRRKREQGLYGLEVALGHSDAKRQRGAA